MKSRHDKLRGEYYIDSKQITAKKGKKNNDTFTPNSLSTSHNHHKYQNYDEMMMQQAQGISLKQFQAFVRSLKKYCKGKDKNSMEPQAQKGELAQKLYNCLRQQYRIVGDPIKIAKLQAQIREFLPQRPRYCEKCSEHKIKCNENQLRYLKQVLPNDIQELEGRLKGLIKENQLCYNILEEKKGTFCQQATISQLRQIVKSQQQTIKQLQMGQISEKSVKGSTWKRQKLKLEIFIEQNEK